MVLSFESKKEYLALANTLYEMFDPQGTYEHTLVKRMADRMWELERALVIKADMLEESQYRDVREQELALLERYETRIERSLYRTRQELISMQRLRGRVFPGDVTVLLTKSREDLVKEWTQIKPKPLSLPVVESTTHVGPHVPALPSQGEAALDQLLNQAKLHIQRGQSFSRSNQLTRHIDKMADMALALEDTHSSGPRVELAHSIPFCGSIPPPDIALEEVSFSLPPSQSP